METNHKAELGKTLKTLTSLQVVEHEGMKEKFIEVYSTIHKEDEAEAEAVWEREKYFILLAITSGADKAALKVCTPISMYSTIIDLAVRGLSLQPGAQATCFLITRGVKVGNNEYEKRAYLDVSGYGELILRMRAGHVKYVDSPQEVYPDDEFEQYNTNEGISINHVIRYPRGEMKDIQLIYVRITRMDDSVTYGILSKGIIEDLKNASASQNNGKYNKLYDTSLSFLYSKTLRHAFKSFPRLKIATLSTITKNEKETLEDVGLTTQKETPAPAPTPTPTESAPQADKIPEHPPVSTPDPILNGVGPRGMVLDVNESF